MKDISSILRRAVTLLTFTDRCALEDKYINGRVYPLEERERQRQAIFNWLVQNGYDNYLTDTEKQIFQQNVGEENSKEILALEVMHEAIEPLLWTVGFIKKLSDFGKFVDTDFHPLLEIGRNHSLNSLVVKGELKKEEDVLEQREITMLWHWRAREGKNPIFTEKDARGIVVDVFGSNYKLVANQIKYHAKEPKDFAIIQKPFYSLTEQEIREIEVICYWRQYALEWVTSGQEWGEIEINT